MSEVSHTLHYIDFLHLLLLAAPTWLWDRCGRHNSPPASSVMDLVFRRSDGSHVSVDTVHTSLLRSSSLSFPGWYHLQSLTSYVVLVSPLYVAKPPESRFPAPLSGFPESWKKSCHSWKMGKKIKSWKFKKVMEFLHCLSRITHEKFR